MCCKAIVNCLTIRQIDSQDEGDFEICVHIDGSTDNTSQQLSNIVNPRLRVSSGENRGRGSALYKTVSMAYGEFIMIFDDDEFENDESDDDEFEDDDESDHRV